MRWFFDVWSPGGLLPLHGDLQRLFPEVLKKDYARELYDRQFTFRVPKNLAKLDRLEESFRTTVENPPQVVFDTLAAQRERLVAAREKLGEYLPPFAW